MVVGIFARRIKGEPPCEHHTPFLRCDSAADNLQNNLDLLAPDPPERDRPDGVLVARAKRIAPFAEVELGIDKVRIAPPGPKSTKRQVSWLADRRLLPPSQAAPSGRVERGFPPTVAGAAVTSARLALRR
jgi:hypothetical protein